MHRSRAVCPANPRRSGNDRRHAGSSEFLIERRSVEQMDDVTVVVEEAPGLSVERLEADLRQALGVRLGCRVVQAGALPRAPALAASRTTSYRLSVAARCPW